MSRYILSFVITLLFLLLLLFLPFFADAQGPTATFTPVSGTPTPTPPVDTSAFRIIRNIPSAQAFIVDDLSSSGCNVYEFQSGIPRWEQYWSVIVPNSSDVITVSLTAQVDKPHAYYSTWQAFIRDPDGSDGWRIARLECGGTTSNCDRNDNGLYVEADWQIDVFTYTTPVSLTSYDDVSRLPSLWVGAGTATTQDKVPYVKFTLCVVGSEGHPPVQVTPTPTSVVSATPTPVPTLTPWPTPTPIEPPFEVVPPDHYTCYQLLPDFVYQAQPLGFNIDINFPGFQVCLAPYRLRLKILGVDWFAVAGVLIAFGGVAALYSRFK